MLKTKWFVRHQGVTLQEFQDALAVSNQVGLWHWMHTEYWKAWKNCGMEPSRPAVL